MFYTADKLEGEDGSVASASSGHGSASAGAPLTHYVPQGSRYGEGRRMSPMALAITIGIHALIALVLLGLSQTVMKEEKERLVAVNLMAPQPPQPQPDPQPQQPTVVTPRPMIDIPTPNRPVVQVVDPLPDPPPPQPVTAPAQPPAPPAPPAPPSIISASDLGTRMVSGSPPKYPVESRRKHEEGTVVLALILGVDGAIEQISISRSSGSSRLDQAALSAVRKWRWSPTMQGGKPVKVRGVVEIPFVLQA